MEFIKKNLFIVVMIVIIILGIIVYFLIPRNDNNYEQDSILKLFGLNTYNLELNEEYIEPGYYAIDKYGQNDTSLVKVTNNLDVTNPGTYEIIYEYDGKKEIRIINVVKPEVSESDIKFSLIGEKTINLDLNEEYNEPGFLAKYKGEDLNEFVTVDDNIEINKIGEYIVKYKLLYEDISKELERKVIVEDNSLIVNINYDSNKYYKDSLKLNIEIKGNSFSYLKLPDNNISKELNTIYEIKENGNYTFIAYNNKNEKFEKIVAINEFDKEIDLLNCNVDVYRKKSIIKINAKDSKSGINNYLYNNKKYTTNNITINSRLNNAKVGVYDKVGNYKEMNCSIKIVEKEPYGFILIGDSRFASSVGVLKDIGSNLRNNDTIIARGGEGISWLKSTAINKVNDILKNNPDKIYYIMTNLGYNDRNKKNISNQYIELLNKLAKEDWKGQLVGFISVNPYASSNQNDSINTLITNFNSNLKNELVGYYYCDTYNGIGFSNFQKRSSSDKTHFSAKTNIEIYNYIINNCNF